MGIQIKDVRDYRNGGTHQCGAFIVQGTLYLRVPGERFRDFPYDDECACSSRGGLLPTRKQRLAEIRRLLGARAPEAVLVNSDGGSHNPFESKE